MGEGGTIAGQLLAVAREYGCGSAVDGCRKSVDASKSIGSPFDEPFGSRRGGLDAHGGHIVEHSDVTLMADAYDDREGKLGYVGGKLVALEGCQVGCGSASAYYHDTIPLFLLGCHGLEGTDYGLGCACALHERGEEPCIEAQVRGGGEELMHEIAVSGRSGSRDDGYALYQLGPLQLAVEVEDTFGLEAREYLHTAPHEVAHRV